MFQNLGDSQIPTRGWQVCDHELFTMSKDMRNLPGKWENKDANHFTQETGCRSASKRTFQTNLSSLGKEELPIAKPQHATPSSPAPEHFGMQLMLIHPAGLLLSLTMAAVDAGAGIPYRVQ